jgi:thiosulfate/3-mercaptopyruvate sulfurtransferase
MMRLLLVWLVFGLLVVSCTTPPTVVKQTSERLFTGGSQLLSPIKIDAATVVVDARSAFDYSMSHVPHSINLKWSDFCDPEHPGYLQSDLQALSRRLALSGIRPTTHVVVLGYGIQGKGEEGRLAWTLAYLGVSNVQFAEIDSMRFRMTNVTEENLVPSVTAWTAEPVESLSASRDEVLFVINKRGIEKPVAFKPGDSPKLYRMIDVRSAKDYLGHEGFGARVRVPNLDAINIPWREFFDSQLRPLKEMADHLSSIGIEPGNRIIVLSEDGVTSAAVALALRGLGFDKSANYPGGLSERLSAHPIN